MREEKSSLLSAAVPHIDPHFGEERNGAKPGDLPTSELLTTTQFHQEGGWKTAVVAKDVATLGVGNFIAAAFNTVLVFLIPHLVSIEDFGYWRLFTLYAGYVGFLHLGLLDGVMLRWAGKDFPAFRGEIQSFMQYLLVIQALVVLPLCGVFLFGFSNGARFVAIAVCLSSFILNPVALLQYALQAARRFRPVAISVIAGPGLLLCFVYIWRLNRWQAAGYQKLIILYVASWAISMAMLIQATKPWIPRSAISRSVAKQCLVSGWPIVVANTVAGLTLSIDRLALSWTSSIHNFAQYSLAASAMAVPITAIQASSKVLFPHLAGLPDEARRGVYGIASRSLLIAWAMLLPYYFLLDLFVRRFLPKYIPSLPVARILLLGIVFVAGTQILQATFSYLYGKQVHFLRQTLIVLILGAGLVCLVAFQFGSLELLAVSQVVILGSWWLYNEWNLRGVTLQRSGDWVKFLAVFVAISASYLSASWVRDNLEISALIYLVSLAVILRLFLNDDVRTWVRVIREHQSSRS